MLYLVPFSKLYLDKSYEWLNDPEIQVLINGPIHVTHEGQKIWYAQIINDPTYQIWGIEYDKIPIGVCGIKHIDFEKKNGEYWGYIGEKKYWGNKGNLILKKIYYEACKLGIKTLKLSVLKSNARAINLYKKEGFELYSENECSILMIKQM